MDYKIKKHITFLLYTYNGLLRMKRNMAPATNSNSNPVSGMTSMELKMPVLLERLDVTSHTRPLNSAWHRQLSSTPRSSSTQTPPFWQGQIRGSDFGGSSAEIKEKKPLSYIDRNINEWVEVYGKYVFD